MRRRRTVRGPRARAALVAAAIAGTLPAVSAPPPSPVPRVLVLASGDRGPYVETLAGIEERLAADPSTSSRVVRILGPERPGSHERPTESTVVLAVGSTALAVAHSWNAPSDRVVGCMVLDPEDLHRSPRVGGVHLRFPVEVELEWLRRILPKARNVGVLWNSDANAALLERAEAVAAKQGIRLHPRRIETPSDIPAALESLRSVADVLWAVPDPRVLTPETAKPFLLFSIRNRIPMIGLSSPWARAGALYALDRDYRDIGRQCAEAAARIVEGKPASSPQVVGPRRAELFLNLRTASQLKVDLPEDLVRSARETFE